MVNQIINQFQTSVLDNIESFEKSIIHGDINEQNILVSQNSLDGKFHVSGILDFGDSQYSVLLFDLAIALTYMMLSSGHIQSAGYFLAGYETLRKVPDAEKRVLKAIYIF